MQEKYVNMQDDHIYMRDNYVDVQVSNLFRESDFNMDKFSYLWQCLTWSMQDATLLIIGIWYAI